MLETLRRSRNVFLSPHYDDIAFSLGLTAREIDHRILINLFTRSINLPTPPSPASGRGTSTGSAPCATPRMATLILYAETLKVLDEVLAVSERSFSEGDALGQTCHRQLVASQILH